MIKVKWLVRFSTLRFPSKYMLTFELSRQLRSCISLQQLAEFVRTNDTGIQELGKTIVLEYFNEFPLNYTYRTMRSPLHIYEYVLGLQGLTLYEEQLRYSILCKLIEYAPWDAKEMERRAHEQERRILARTKEEPFDLVDALNWIIIHRPTISSELIERSLEIICAVPLERSEAIIARLLNSFLKKIEDVQWRSLRKFRPIFEFLCNKYEFTIETPKLMVSNFEKLAELKLHLLGYDRVPKAIDQIATRLEGVLPTLEMPYLQNVFKCFDHLPPGHNRRLFGLLFREIMERLNRQIFHLSSLPLTRLTRQQLETFMRAFVGQGLYMRHCIYFINGENSQQLFNSQVFVNALTEAFLRPPKAEENLEVDYSSYTSVAFALLNHYKQDHPLRPKILKQLKTVQKAVFKPGRALEKEKLNCSLCGWFNIYSLELEFGLFQSRRQLEDALEEEMARFSQKKFGSTWKLKKHHQQLREIASKHAGSPFPQIRAFFLTLLKTGITLGPHFDSNYYPAYIYFLEDCGQTKSYESVLSHLYGLLRGDQALAFVQDYICALRKTAKLTITIMEKLWSASHSPEVILKLIAGVPQVYFQNGLGELQEKATSVLDDVAILAREADLASLSEGQLANLIRFCRKFLKSIRILSHKLLILALGKVEKQKGKVDGLRVELPIQILALTLKLSYSDKQLCIGRINTWLHEIQESAINNPLALLRLLQARLMLKSSASIDLAATNEILMRLVERVRKEQDLPERAKLMVILLKLHGMQELELSLEDRQLFCEQAKSSLQKESLHPSDIPQLLGSNFIEQCDHLSWQRLQQLKNILLNSLGVGVQEEPQFYAFLLRFAHKIRATEIIDQSLDHLTLLPLDPSFLIVLTNILKHYTFIYRPQLIDRLLKDTSLHFSTFRQYHIDILYYIHTVCYDILPEHIKICNKLLQQVEKDLLEGVTAMLSERQPESNRLIQMLIKTYKYYWVAIKSKQISDTTLSIFKLNIRHIKTVCQTANFSTFDGISVEIISMIHIALFPAAIKLEEKEQKQLPQGKTKFFSSKREVEKYADYRNEAQKLSLISKLQPLRSFELEEQLHKLKIYYKQKHPKQAVECDYGFGQRKMGIQLNYDIRNGNIHYYVFVVIPKMRNSSGLFKGRVRLLQELYTIILGSQPILYDKQDPIVISFS